MSSAYHNHQSTQILTSTRSSNVGTQIITLPHSNQTGMVRVKRERSPTPPPSLSRRLVTSGAKWCFPVPSNCQKTAPNWANHRKEWLERERGVLRSLGVKTGKVYLRDDGLSIDWMSDVPVWSDTLRPASEPKDLASAIERTHTVNEISSLRLRPAPKAPVRALPPPPRPSFIMNGTTNPSPAQRQKMTTSPPYPIPPPMIVPAPRRSAREVAVRSNWHQDSSSISIKNEPSTWSPLATGADNRGRFTQSQGGDTPLPNVTTHVPFVPAFPSSIPSGVQNRFTPGRGNDTSQLSFATQVPPVSVPWSISPSVIDQPTQSPSPNASPQVSRVPSLSPRMSTPAMQPSRPPEKPETLPNAPTTQGTTGFDFNAVLHTPVKPITEPDPSMTDIEAASLVYLKRYIQTFDADRSSLAPAYSRNAFFSYQFHVSQPGHSPLTRTSFVPDSGSRIPAKGAHNIKQGRLEIMSALLSMGKHKFCTSGPSHVQFDVKYLGEVGVLVVCNGELMDPLEQHQKIFLSQSFLLRKKDEDEEDRVSEEVWPLVAVSHQMTIREQTSG
ncbi:hypothetical protein SERLA73DRAFT_181982 [Serpula lacrymans var. lacrymans S7.3]|uniref:NTF2 domain-containing protein n=2 Tax=Serpula lacrymans var. lacrymans TaxID=341189 RepID=F8PZ36_SERL3|nr:uncharacterized protein SERLADRAFT_468416 [Serpula lacrymans var. lacrymans S7.9]EGN99149.1 hypothetical protein SERLA73DRAFT_181982 [Serpula lacrymans var. lacrymans S7.3]EGO24716.1 hypothetical protein SERLADRAFT_468416 [Serpula lacrymans var. lacrymans S7.9]